MHSAKLIAAKLLASRVTKLKKMTSLSLSIRSWVESLNSTTSLIVFSALQGLQVWDKILD